ncbi:MAG: DNA replication and repair protein RecF [candidate division WOR-3 bacterium]|nr:DNA replication and repair protein RecF [candidate division WOR-3 bacterium]MCX7757244.1 DNA replication and repair protein RecF [candidate division WOR-3 bacterium]MDW7987588.1 DNA replication and repair protein RecF [candidate division WOR-3 bacterium]
MVLKHLAFEGFRNLVDSEVDFHPEINLIVGENASGKTSLLEAIYYLAVGRSFRTHRDNELKKFGAPHLKVRGEAEGPQGYTTAQIVFYEGTKLLSLADRKILRLSDYLGWCPVITILLEDIELIRGAPNTRRDFINLAIAQLNRNYLKDLIEYRKALQERNKLLNEKVDESYYEVWEKILAQIACRIIEERKKKLSILLDYAQKYSDMLFEGKKIVFRYKSDHDLAELSSATEIERTMLELLKNKRTLDIELGHTTVGPHRDDIIVEEVKSSGEKLLLSKYGSEGEQRLCALALKLAEAQMIQEFRNLSPIYLLDEIAAELDSQNTKKLFRSITGQMFYATAKDQNNLGLTPGKVFKITKGTITSQ